MIKELTANSGGAQIKVLSDREKEKVMHEIPVSISGNLSVKLKAAILIAERIEMFKQNAKARSFYLPS
jgi:hypothetical protein